MQDEIFIGCILLMSCITASQAAFCKKKNAHSLFGSSTELCMAGCCGPEDDQHCCISNSTYMILITVCPIALIGIIIMICCCIAYQKKTSVVPAGVRTNTGFGTGYLRTQPTIVTYSNPPGTATVIRPPPPGYSQVTASNQHTYNQLPQATGFNSTGYSQATGF